MRWIWHATWFAGCLHDCKELPGSSWTKNPLLSKQFAWKRFGKDILDETQERFKRKKMSKRQTAQSQSWTRTSRRVLFESWGIIERSSPSNFLSCDETNCSEDPGTKKMLFRRGCKYPKCIMNSSKGSISIMFAGSASGRLLPPYVAYKSTHLWQSWTEGGPPGARFGRTKTGWFDAISTSIVFFH